MRIIRVLGIAFLLASATAAQKSPKLEIGVIIGEPTGLSGKYWLSDRSAVAAITGWSFVDGIVNLSADYQFHYFWFDFEPGSLPLYFGLGAALQVSDEDAFLGARIPFGISYYFPEAPFDAFVEVAPLMEIIPETKVRVEGGIGLRLTF